MTKPLPHDGSPPTPGASGDTETARPKKSAALTNPEAHLGLLIESAKDYAIFSMDRERRVSTWNTGAERVFGYTEAEIVGQSADVIFTPEDRARGAPDEEAAVARKAGRAMDERWHVRKNGERFYASGVMSPLLGEDGSWNGFVKIARDLTERKLAEERLRTARSELEERVRQRTAELHASNAALRSEIEQRKVAEALRQQLLRRIGRAQEEERLRLSRELHDEIGQHLAALMLGLNSLQPDLASTPGAKVLSKLQGITETIGRAVHALAVQLRPAALDDLGLLRAITTYVELWSARTGVKVELHTANIDEPRLPPDIELALYRSVQEALTNVMKHAAATRVSVILNRPDGEVVAIIEDNGRGFDAEQPLSTNGKGLGLLGMRERAEQLNGHVTIESQPGSGTTVFVRLPLE